MSSLGLSRIGCFVFLYYEGNVREFFLNLTVFCVIQISFFFFATKLEEKISFPPLEIAYFARDIRYNAFHKPF